MITPSTVGPQALKFKLDFVADTLAELTADLPTYLGKYVRVADQANAIFYVILDRNEYTAIPAFDHTSYAIDESASRGLYIQDTQPADLNEYLWIQTNIGGNQASFTFWFNDN